MKPIKLYANFEEASFVEREGKKPALLEVKSCSLCHNCAVMFPDAPTERGKRHLQDLELLAAQGYDTYTL